MQLGCEYARVALNCWRDRQFSPLPTFPTRFIFLFVSFGLDRGSPFFVLALVLLLCESETRVSEVFGVCFLKKFWLFFLFSRNERGGRTCFLDGSLGLGWASLSFHHLFLIPPQCNSGAFDCVLRVVKGPLLVQSGTWSSARGGWWVARRWKERSLEETSWRDWMEEDWINRDIFLMLRKMRWKMILKKPPMYIVLHQVLWLGIIFRVDMFNGWWARFALTWCRDMPGVNEYTRHLKECKPNGCWCSRLFRWWWEEMGWRWTWCDGGDMLEEMLLEEI